MATTILSEAFQSLRDLNEDVFDLNAQGVNELKDFVADDAEPNIEDQLQDVIDPIAATEEDLQDSYDGKVILDCAVCQSKTFVNPEDVIIDEASGLANTGDGHQCPYCMSVDGYKIIGEVAPYSKTEVDVEVTPKEDGSEEANIDLTTDEKEKEIDESMADNKEDNKEDNEQLKESIDNLTIDTDKETINVSTTEKSEAGEEMIAPVTPETEAKFEKPEEENSEIADENPNVEPEYQDVDINEFDENEFDGLGESYLKNVYENVKSYKTSNGSINGNQLKLEGIITFKSGKQAKTNFMFEAKTMTKNGKLKFVGENKQFAKGSKSFTLTGRVNNGKLIAESLNYNYKTKDTATGALKRLYGTVKA